MTFFYVDYGNFETLSNSRIRQIPPEFTALPYQAKEARLAYVRIPSLNDEFGHEAALFLKEMVWGKPMMANVEFRDGDVLYLSLGDRESQVHVNAALLRAGLGRVEKVRGRFLQPLLEKLREEENKARSAHVYMWQYGDPGSDEEDDRDLQKSKGPKDKSAKKPAIDASKATKETKETKEDKPKDKPKEPEKKKKRAKK